MNESSYLVVAEEVLRDMPKRTGHINDIAEVALLKNKNFGLDHDTLKTKINAALSAAVKRKSGSKFSRVLAKGGVANKGPYRKGIYRLKISRSPQVRPVFEPTSKDFLGKGGEYAVASELMFRDFNVSLMVVDKGIDLVAEKNNIYFNIQGITASENNGSWLFTVKNNSFQSNLSGQTYYVLVARDIVSNVFFILPASQIEIWLKGGVLGNGKTALSIKITKKDGGRKWMLGNVDISALFVGAFHLIK